MNVHISYKVSKTPDLEKEFNQQIQKMGKRLQFFRPELVHLHAIIEENNAREGPSVSLNLRLPSGQMAAKENGATPTAAIKAAFEQLRGAAHQAQGHAAQRAQVAPSAAHRAPAPGAAGPV